MAEETNKSTLKNPWFYVLVIVAIIAIVLAYKMIVPRSAGTGEVISDESESAESGYDNFAQCLTDAGLKMYGTDWCGYCKEQKKMFGKSFDNIAYVDCDYNKDECTLEGIRGYPTWKINGEAYSGVQSFETLSRLTGCEL